MTMRSAQSLITGKMAEAVIEGRQGELAALLQQTLRKRSGRNRRSGSGRRCRRAVRRGIVRPINEILRHCAHNKIRRTDMRNSSNGKRSKATGSTMDCKKALTETGGDMEKGRRLPERTDWPRPPRKPTWVSEGWSVWHSIRTPHRLVAIVNSRPIRGQERRIR